MKNRARQRRNRQYREEMISYRNHEHYADPTAYYAIRNIVKEGQKRSAISQVKV